MAAGPRAAASDLLATMRQEAATPGDQTIHTPTEGTRTGLGHFRMATGTHSQIVSMCHRRAISRSEWTNLLEWASLVQADTGNGETEGGISVGQEEDAQADAGNRLRPRQSVR